MSRTIFNDVITLYIKNGSSYFRRVIKNVNFSYSEKFLENSSGELIVPIYYRRDVKYLPRELFKEYSHSKRYFTINVGDMLVLGDCDKDTPPENAFTVVSISENTVGSHRMHHVTAGCKKIIYKEAENEYT